MSKPTFEINPFYERLIALRARDRKTFDSLSQPTRWTLLEYEKQKREHEQLEAMRQEKDLPPAA
jgi:hypothetical protein